MVPDDNNLHNNPAHWSDHQTGRGPHQGERRPGKTASQPYGEERQTGTGLRGEIPTML